MHHNYIQNALSALFLLFSFPFFAQYTGSASVSQGPATATTSNLYECSGGRVAKLGSITASDNSLWTVPAVVNFTNSAFPFSSDLHNACIGANYANAAVALAALNGSDIVTVDVDGELITAFIFADNYFELYINGMAVGKDKVPFTQFNSSIVRFKVKRPFSIAMLLVDWEENLGLGSENNMGFAYHPGDGGIVAVFKDSGDNIIATTSSAWKAQTFYTSPITDLSCPSENGSLRLSNNCSTANSSNGSAYYALHWPRPVNWMNANFDDSNWPNATEYSNAEIGVNNKPAYTNFTDIFDDPAADAPFIWSSNVVLDNEVILRHKVLASSGARNPDIPGKRVFPNPFQGQIQIFPQSGGEYFELSDAYGKLLFSGEQIESVDFHFLPAGYYSLKITDESGTVLKKLIKL